MHVKILKIYIYFIGFQVGEHTCRAVLTACTCGLPARALVMNLVQYNGFYGISHCLQGGES